MKTEARCSRISELVESTVATVSVHVTGVRMIPVRGRFNKSMLEVRCADESGAQLALKWFHAPRGIEQRFKPGVQLIVTGMVKKFMGRPEIVRPRDHVEYERTHDRHGIFWSRK